MKTTTRHLIAALCTISILALAAEAQPGQGSSDRGRTQARQGQQGPGMGREGGGLDIMPVLMKLNLTEEQHQKVRTILDRSKEASQAGQQAVEKARKSLREAVIEEADNDSIRAIATTLSQAVADEAIGQVAVTREIKTVLTEAQKEEFKKLLKEAAEAGPRGRPGQAGPNGPGTEAGSRRGPRQ